jgi:hypothetical protein
MGDIAELFGGEGRSNLLNNITQFELPSPKMSADSQTPAGDGAYAVPLGEEPAHAQTSVGIRSRISGSLVNPTNDPFSMSTILLVGGVIVLLVLVRRYFKGSVV